jgi:hypothetical protein
LRGRPLFDVAPLSARVIYRLQFPLGCLEEIRDSFFALSGESRPLRQKLLSWRGGMTHSLQVIYVGGIRIDYAT